MGHPLAQNGAALAPFRANGAHPSNIYIIDTTTDHITMEAEKHNFRPQHTNLCGAWCGGLRRFAEACGALRTIAAHKIRMRKVAEAL